jgi:hypothetical protein
MATPAQELVAARIAVATATPTQYQRQRWRLAGKVRTGTIDRVTAVDTRYEIAIAHALVRAPGEVGLRRSLLRRLPTLASVPCTGRHSSTCPARLHSAIRCHRCAVCGHDSAGGRTPVPASGTLARGGGAVSRNLSELVRRVAQGPPGWSRPSHRRAQSMGHPWLGHGVRTFPNRVRERFRRSR